MVAGKAKAQTMNYLGQSSTLTEVSNTTLTEVSNIFENVLETGTDAGLSLYSTYQTLAQARARSASIIEQAEYDLQIAQLEQDAIRFLQEQESGQTESLTKGLTIAAIVGALGIVAFFIFKK